MHDVVPVPLWQPAEFVLSARRGLALAIDPESGQRRWLWWRPALRERWQAAHAARRAALEQLFAARRLQAAVHRRSLRCRCHDAALHAMKVTGSGESARLRRCAWPRRRAPHRCPRWRRASRAHSAIRWVICCSATWSCMHPRAGRSMSIRCQHRVLAASRSSCAAWRAPSSARTVACATSCTCEYQVFFAPAAVRTFDMPQLRLALHGAASQRDAARRCVADHGGAAGAARGAGAARPGRPAARPRAVHDRPGPTQRWLDRVAGAGGRCLARVWPCCTWPCRWSSGGGCRSRSAFAGCAACRPTPTRRAGALPADGCTARSTAVPARWFSSAVCSDSSAHGRRLRRCTTT